MVAAVLELLYGVFLFVVLGAAEQAYTFFGIASVFLFMAIGGFWVGSKATAHNVLQGGLVGLVAVLIYTVLTIPAVVSGELAFTGPLLINHLAKVIGGALGGALSTAIPATLKQSSTQRQELAEGDQD